VENSLTRVDRRVLALESAHRPDMVSPSPLDEQLPTRLPQDALNAVLSSRFGKLEHTLNNSMASSEQRHNHASVQLHAAKEQVPRAHPRCHAN
jgi:hypothetical protein